MKVRYEEAEATYMERWWESLDKMADDAAGFWFSQGTFVRLYRVPTTVSQTILNLAVKAGFLETKVGSVSRLNLYREKKKLL